MSLRRTAAAFAVALALGAIAGCSSGTERELPPIGSANITPETLWKRISVESPYRRYAEWPEHRGVQMGQAPHGSLHRIYINGAIARALPIADLKVPDGGLIVMENLDPSSRLVSISVMAKTRGFDPKNNDWYWAEFEPSGKATAQGSVRTCVLCHAGMIDNDFVIVRRLGAPLK